VSLLVLHFLESYKQKSGRFVSGISAEAMRALVNYDWPGNVRELENAVERAIIVASGRQIELADLPDAISKVAANSINRHRVFQREGGVSIEVEIPSTIDEIERHVIEATLDYAEGDKSKTARLLNIGRKTLYRRLDEMREEAK